MSGSATYVWHATAHGPEWRSAAGAVAAVRADGETDGTRASVRGRRYVAVGGEWVIGIESVAAIEASAFGAGAVLQVTAAPGVVPVRAARYANLPSRVATPHAIGDES